MKRALVTGHKGFVGRHIARALQDSGYDVIGVDIRNGGRIGIAHEFAWDVRSFFRLESELRGMDVVVHCAAVEPHRSAIDGRPAWVGAENLSLDAALFRWVQETRPLHTIYISSSAAYPIDLQTPGYLPRTGLPVFLHEDHIDLSMPRRPDAIYGEVKLMGERLANLVRDSGAWISVVRPFSGYGTTQSSSFPFGAFIERARAKEDPFVIWGSGDQVRDWIHIDDIVGAMLEIIKLRPDTPLNLGTGIPTSLNNLAKMVVNQAGYTPTFKHARTAPSGVVHRVADIGRLLDFYKPKISIEEGIRRALA